MKTILRNLIINSLIIFLLSQVFTGVRVEDGVQTILIAGFALTFLSFILKPILKILLFPFNILTLGTFSFFINILINALVLYFLTLFVPKFNISSFSFPGLNIFGVIIPEFYLSTFFAFIFIAFMFSAIATLVQWLIKE